jgi:hypothetical protein
VTTSHHLGLCRGCIRNIVNGFISVLDDLIVPEKDVAFTEKSLVSILQHCSRGD